MKKIKEIFKALIKKTKSALYKIYSMLHTMWESIKKNFLALKRYTVKYWIFLKENWLKWIDLVVRYTLLYFFRIFWKWNAAKKLQRFFMAFSVTAAYIIVVLLLAWLLSDYDIFGISGFITNEASVDFSSVLLTLVGMLGTIMAIVFSLSVLAIQKSSDSYSSRYIRNFIWDWREYSIYSIFALSIVALLYFVFRPDLYGVNILFSAYLSLLILAFLLYLIFAQYKTVTKKIDPYYVLTVLAKESAEQIKNIEAYSQQLSAINTFTKDSSIVIKSVIFQYNLSPLKSRIKDIYSIAMRLSDKGDIETVNYGFEAIKRILLTFFKGIKDSTFIHLSEHGLLSFDAKENNFLAHLYEKLETAGVKFMEINAWDNARTIVDIYYESCMATAEIKPALNTSLALIGENPMFNLTRGYFAKFIEVAMAKKDLETVFKATQVIEPIMKSTIDNNLHVQCSLLIGTVRKLLIYDIINGINLLPEYCVDIYLKSIKHIVFSKNNKLGYYFLQSFFNELKEVFTILPFNAQVKFEVELQTMILDIGSRADGNYADNIVSFFGQLYEFFLDQFRLQKINSNLWLIAQLLEDTTIVIQKLDEHEAFAAHKKALKELILDFIQLPVTFYGFIKGESLSEDKLALKLTTVIYKPVQNRLQNEPELLKACAENMVKIIDYLFRKNKYDAYHELPGIALKLVYLGTFAKKWGFSEVADYVVLNLYDFEYRYVEKYFAHLPEDQQQSLRHERERLSIEISHWRDIVRGWRQNDRVFFENDGITYGINLEDVDNFIFYAWGYFFNDSHIEELLQKKQLIRRLIVILMNR